MTAAELERRKIEALERIARALEALAQIPPPLVRAEAGAGAVRPAAFHGWRRE